MWGEETFVDFERGLRYCIGHIRSALGDTAEAPRFVETLPRRGYRFLPRVEVGTRPPSGGAEVATPVARWRLAAGLAAALAIAASLAVAFGVGRGAGTGAAEPVRLAVVPFDNETGLPAYDALARRLSDAVVVRLAAIDPERLAVVGNAAVLFQPRSRRDLEEIGRRLDVEYVILGQVQGDAGRVRVLTHLIRVADQSHLWATRVERDGSNVSEIERMVPAEVAGAVATRLLAGS